MSRLKLRGKSAVPPQKSATAYNIFGKEKRAEILLKNPKAKVTAVVKETARCWAHMTKQDRTKYDLEAKQGK